MLQLQAALVSVLFLGVEEAHWMKIHVRNPSRLYLCQPQLLPSPHFMTPWTQLYESYNNRAYITMMGFNVTTFHQLLNNGFANKWNSTPIPHADQIFALIPTTINCYLDFALDILLQTLRDMPEGAIHFPDHNEIVEDNLLICACHSKLVGGFGSIDGLSLPCQEADDPEVENATYNGWKSSHFISNKTPDGYYLIADSAFPHGMAAISGKIQALLKSGAQAELLTFNWQLLSYCQTAEWGMQMMQGSFG
ncbi:hypothetical protein BDR04DRAFT_1125703 [Suillus decipiens]|nr:hypothetical protein BDR04DRAFT_1125703 [Suillus decipiens]